jgi:NTE family protein
MIYDGKKSRLKTALVLGGGGSKGAVQVGALKVILDKIIPDVIIGTSIGAFNGAFVALDKPLEALENIWLTIKQRDLLKANPEVFWKLTYASSLYSRKGAHKWLRKTFNGYRFEDCKIPLYLSATRLSDGKGVFLHKGLLADAIQASCSIPPVLPPYEIEGVKYIDGGFSNYVGTEEALALNCKQIIVINAGFCGKREKYGGDMFELIQHSIDFLTYQSLKNEVAQCKHDNVVEIDPASHVHYNIIDFKHGAEMLALGVAEAKKQIKKIKM